MHNVKKKLHLNVSPESIVMTPSGQWKLCGFGFSLGFVAGNEMQIPCPYFLNPAPTAVRLEPDLRYTAPELTEGGTQLQDIRYATRACDVFSLALVAYEMYHYNLRLAPAGKRNYPPVQMIANSVASHYEAMHTGLRSLDLSALPPGFSQVLSCMLQENPTARIALLDVVNSAYFHSGILSTLKSVDSLPERDMGTQASVLASLPGQLGQLPPRILAMIVLPGLCDLTTANPSMWNYTMPVHVFVASKLNARDYQRVVENAFILGLQETSVDALLAFIRNMDHLRDNFDVDFFKTHVAKMICNALDNKLSALQIQSLQALADEKVFTVIDMPEFVANIIPRVCKAACKSSEVAVKVKALYFMSLGAKRLDKNYLIQNYIPSLKYIVDNERSPAVSMCVLGVYDSISEIVKYDAIATGILPVLTPMLADRNLNKDQYSMVIDRVAKFLEIVSVCRSEDL
ncbi:unnamed protein product, partial [Ectocarpus fasciculatus]